MQRTISVMVGKGSVKHNSRVFNAGNTDPERSHLNQSYCNEDIREVYHELFDEALERYNNKQTRSDRVIPDYYEKILSGKQEKPFHEIILQIGNSEDMNSKSEEGKLAAFLLGEYMQTFQARNPNMRVFSAHLHQDEATPHLHIDFVPFTSGSKRGLETRVSLKQALAAQGFKGGTRQETEWNQWVASEKKELSKIMGHYDIFWLQKGTHEKHLSVLDYEKKVRSEEVAELETRIVDLHDEVQEKRETVNEVQTKLDELQVQVDVTDRTAHKFDTAPEWQLPEPTRLMSASSYKTKIVEPFIKKLKGVIRSVVAQYLDLKSSVSNLNRNLSRAYSSIDQLRERLEEARQDNSKLAEIAKDYKRVESVLGAEQTESIVAEVKAEEQAHRNVKRLKSRDRGR